MIAFWPLHAHLRCALSALGLAVLTGCALPSPTGVTDLMERPAERLLINGLRQYDDAMYPEAEKTLSEALRMHLASPRDQAMAHKTLAFIYCTTERPFECSLAFRSALKADPKFALTKAEAGHPVWGPVYAKSRH